MKDVHCDDSEIALKSFFLGPQAENGPWVLQVINGIFNEWFRWRQQQFPDDGMAISLKDQNTPEFLKTQRSFERHVALLASRFEQEVPKFAPRYIGHMFSEISLPALLGHLITLLHNPNNVSVESSRVGKALEDEAIKFLAQMLGLPLSNVRGHFTSGGTMANFEALSRARDRCARWLGLHAAARSRGLSNKSLFEAAHCGWKDHLASREESLLKAAEDFDFSGRSPANAFQKLSQIYQIDFEGPVILAPAHCHYSWNKGAHLFGMGEANLWPIELDSKGHVSIPDLRAKIELARSQQRPIALVVTVLGTTEQGNIDPIDAVQNLLADYKTKEGLHIWHHVDAAYGGFFATMIRNSKNQDLDPTLTGLSPGAVNAIQALCQVTSITLDPHKLAYVPYASGAFLVRESIDYETKSGSAPYISFEEGREHPHQTIEGSRSAGGAVATWLTAQCIGLHSDGYGQIIKRTVIQKQKLENDMELELPECHLLKSCETNIVCFNVCTHAASLSVANDMTRSLYKRLSTSGEGNFFVSKTVLKLSDEELQLLEFFERWKPIVDTDDVFLIRLCLMNPFFSSKEMKTNYYEAFISEIKRFICNPRQT